MPTHDSIIKRLRTLTISLSAISLFGSAIGTAANAAFYSIDPADAYLHVEAGDTAGAAIPIDLAAAGLLPGDVLHIRRIGDFIAVVPGGADDQTGLAGVFSASSVLLSETLLDRVQDAIATENGIAIVSNPTWPSNEPTDISEDFLIGPPGGQRPSAVIVTIPSGATHLFVAVPDNHFLDNSDPDGDFGVEINKIGELFSIDPADAYLHVEAGDSAGAAIPINLAAAGFLPGDLLHMRRVGDFIAVVPGGADDQTGLAGVFSASSVLLGESLLDRVQDAITTRNGSPVVSNPTWPSNESTDISEDFLIGPPAGRGPASVAVTIPTGATHLFLAVPDNHFLDNSDPDGDFGVEIARIGQEFSLDPADSYLHLDPSDVAGAAVPIVLADLNTKPGDYIVLKRIGDFLAVVPGGADDQTTLAGVFSASSVLLPGTLLDRVQDAIASPTGSPIVSNPTWPNSQPTDIPEDFFISGPGTTNSPLLVVQVPPPVPGQLDQLLEPNPTDALKGVSGTVHHAQTFTVGVGGTLESVDILIRQFGTPSDLLFDIRGTVGGIPIENDGTTLAAVPVPSTDVPTDLTWVSVDVSSFNVPVQVGDVLAIVLRTNGSGGYQWGAQQGNPYSGGAPYFRNPGPSWTIQTEDSGFRTYVSQEATHLFVAVPDNRFLDNSDPDGDFAVLFVPEPSWHTLILSGVMGLLVLFRARKRSESSVERG
ncbi:MAG: hypothetical protein JRE70_07245 [Deltaproteobacteria bacterium]|nr:hypothetical protein [Deltaproteobacteria bacterium]